MQREVAALATLKSQYFYVFRSSSQALASMALAPLPRGSDGATNVAAPNGRVSVAPVSRALSLTIRGLIVQVSVRCAPAAAYFAALAPAAAARPSCWPVPPLAPIAPMIFPFTVIGTPPSDATGFSGKVMNAVLPAAY
jgi:hypothetical protein